VAGTPSSNSVCSLVHFKNKPCRSRTNPDTRVPCIAGKRRWLNLLNVRLERRGGREGERDVMNGVKFIITRGSFFFFFVVCCLYIILCCLTGVLVPVSSAVLVLYCTGTLVNWHKTTTLASYPPSPNPIYHDNSLVAGIPPPPIPRISIHWTTGSLGLRIAVVTGSITHFLPQNKAGIPKHDLTYF